MKQRRYTEKVTITDAINLMAEENDEAKECLQEMLKTGISGTLDILMLDALKFYGERIAILWQQCEHDSERLHELMDTYRKRFTNISQRSS